jgi:hypothetical protein
METLTKGMVQRQVRVGRSVTNLGLFEAFARKFLKSVLCREREGQKDVTKDEVLCHIKELRPCRISSDLAELDWLGGVQGGILFGWILVGRLEIDVRVVVLGTGVV